MDMPHIHVQPNQHDMTVSAFILRQEDNKWKCLVHFHRKIDKLMQIGGHIELDETPWQAVAHELEEESGYQLEELELLQHSAKPIVTTGNIQHPTPFAMNTHNVGDEHYHSDMCFGFLATRLPANQQGDGESQDLRWLTIDELHSAADDGEALQDVYHIYAALAESINTYARVPTSSFSLEKPAHHGIVYKRGAASEQRN